MEPAGPGIEDVERRDLPVFHLPPERRQIRLAARRRLRGETEVGRPLHVGRVNRRNPELDAGAAAA